MTAEADVQTDSAPERAALSIEAAAGLLAAGPEQPEAAEDDASSPEPEAEAPETPAQEPVAEPPAPAFWTDEDKAWFSEQPAEVRERVAAYEASREEAASKARAEADEARAGAEAQARSIAAARDEIERLLGEAARRNAESDWQGVDWARWAAEDPAGALQGKIRFEQEEAEVRRLAMASRAADEQAFAAYVAEESRRLAELAPDLASDEAKRAEVGRWLIGQGYGPEALRRISARDVATARKAMLWDRAEAALKAPRPAPAPAPKAVRASAAQAAPSPGRRAQEAQNRFSQTRALDDAVAVLNAR